MKCSVCNKDSDVLAEGKCLSCYENSLAAGPVAPTAAAAASAPTFVSPPQLAAMQNQSAISRLEIPRKATLTLGIPPAATKKKKSFGKRVAKGVMMVACCLLVASGITYYMYFIRVEDDGHMQQADLTAVPAVKKQTDAPSAGSGAETDSTSEDTSAVPGATGSGATSAANNSSGSAATDTQTDSDGDGIPDFIEMRIKTDPYKSDTDGDNVSDADEVHNGTDPTKKDTDGDGCNDNVDKAPRDGKTGCSVIPVPAGLTPDEIRNGPSQSNMTTLSPGTSQPAPSTT